MLVTKEKITTADGTKDEKKTGKLKTVMKSRYGTNAPFKILH